MPDTTSMTGADPSAHHESGSVTVLDPQFAGMPQGADTLPDGRVVCLDVHEGEVVTWSEQHGRQRFAKTSSGPIGLVMGVDGAAYLAHTGGRIGSFWLADDAIEPCVQRIAAGSTQPSTLLTQVDGVPLVAPHDICWGADGRLWLTDSHIWQWDPADRTEPGKIIALDAQGRAEVVVETGVSFPCGITGTPDGAIYWSESYREQLTQAHRAGAEVRRRERHGEVLRSGLLEQEPGLVEVLDTLAKAAGVNVQVDRVDSATFYGAQYGSYQFSPNVAPPTNYLYTVQTTDGPTSTLNYSHFSDPEFTKLFNQLAPELDPSVAKEIAHEMQTIQYERGGLIISGFYDAIDGHADNVGGLVPDVSGLAIYRYADLWLA